MSIGSMPEVGRAAVVTAWGEATEVREYELTPPPPGGLLVRVERATVCGSDVHAWEGALAAGGFDIELPIILGHETVGRIVAFGEGAHVDAVGTPLREGDRVTWAHEACGHCYECTVLGMGTMCPNRRIGFLMSAEAPPHFHGGFAEFAQVPPGAGRLRIPDDVESEWAAAASCALRTVVDAVERLGRVDYRHTVVIQGAGPVGLFATAMLAVGGPRKLVVVGGPASRLEVARAWGADATIDVSEYSSVEARREAVLSVVGGRGADVICEMSGARGAVGEGLQLAAPAARYLVAGTVAGGTQEVDAHLIVRRNLTVIGSLGAEIDAYYKAMEFLRHERDRFDWDLLIGGSYGLDEVTSALAAMRDYSETKAVIVPA
jgi:threonine dehydrogenase-like Zn-dependent dehydrogenase